MYNNFFSQKKEKQIEQKAKKDKRLKKWLDNYHQKKQPELLNRYNQRIKSFITRIQDNPNELSSFQPLDVKQDKKRIIMEKIQALTRKGNKYFRFRDTSDFNSYFNQAQRIQRQENKKFYEKRFGQSLMAHRGIISQSQYNPQLMNEFRPRKKEKQINPSMKYSNRKQSSNSSLYKRSKSVIEKREKMGQHQQDQNNFQIQRRNTSLSSVSFGASQDDSKSCHTLKTQSQNSISRSFLVSLAKPVNNKIPSKKKKQFVKSYFIGMTDIKQNTKDPHLKKTLQNILVKVGKGNPNHRDHFLPQTLQSLVTQLI